MAKRGKIGRCCKECNDGENSFPVNCSCLCHEGAKCSHSLDTHQGGGGTNNELEEKGTPASFTPLSSPDKPLKETDLDKLKGLTSSGIRAEILGLWLEICETPELQGMLEGIEAELEQREAQRKANLQGGGE